MPLEFSRVVVAAPLVSLTVAKDHLRLTDTAHDADVTQKLEAAQEQVIAKLGPAADATWTETTVPRPVRHAILILLDAFYERRGGDEGSEQLRKALQTVDLLLALYHDPSLA
jgi:hypothetical protein